MTSPQAHDSNLGKRKRSDDDDQHSINGSVKTVPRRKAACQACRARKVKCDQARPKCSFCVANSSECAYIEGLDEKPILDPATRILVNRLAQVQYDVDRIHRRMDSGERLLNEQSVHPSSNGSHSTLQAKIELKEDFLEIPTSKTTADAVLTWPIFSANYGSNHLISALDNSPQNDERDHDTFEVADGLRSIPQDRVPRLIDRFLSYVHTKNPILDVDALVCAGRKVAADGFGWNAESCLVMVACALGTVSRPFTEALGEHEGVAEEPVDRLDATSAAVLEEDRLLAETFFNLASRRLGLVKHTILGSQCHFFSGVYLMYTFRPLQAWTQFYQASTCYQFFLKTVGGPSAERPDFYDADRLQQMGHVQRRIEQSLYWSCFKSEVEMRIDIPLMQSSICHFQYPAMFPSPPCRPKPPAAPPTEESPNPSGPGPPWHQVIEATYGKNISSFKEQQSPSVQPNGDKDSTRQNHTLYNEEESWFYYLTEVALRRIENRIINTFYRSDYHIWMDIGQWIPLAKEFEAQIRTWSATLPPAMQNFNDPRALRGNGSTTRVQAVDDEPQKDPEGNRASASMELSWCTENRLLEMQSCLYQPFLYYAIHSALDKTAHAQSLSSIPSAFHNHYQEFVRAGVVCNLKILRWRTLHHRHHGIWFDLRGVMTAIVILCAIVRSAAVEMPPCLFQDDSTKGNEPKCGLHQHQHHCISFDTVFKRLRYWADESPDVKHSILILEELVGVTRTRFFAGPSFTASDNVVNEP